MSELENYLDDSDFLSSSDEEAGFISSDDEENSNQLINSIINKRFTSFIELIKNKKCLKEEIYDNVLKKCHERIKTIAHSPRGGSFCFYIVPSFLFLEKELTK